MLMNLEDIDSEFGTWFVQCTYFILCVQWGIFWELLKMWQFVEVGRFSFQIKIVWWCWWHFGAIWEEKLISFLSTLFGGFVHLRNEKEEDMVGRLEWHLNTFDFKAISPRKRKKHWVHLSWERWKYLDNLEDTQFFEKVLMSWLIIINFLGVIW